MKGLLGLVLVMLGAVDRTHMRTSTLFVTMACMLTGSACGDDATSMSAGSSGDPAGSSGTTGATPMTTSVASTGDVEDSGSTATADSSDSSDGDSSDSGDPVDPKPPVPEGLVHFITGNEDDADVEPTGPGVILMGGGPEVDEAYQWWGDYIAGGDVVVIRTSGSDGYNQYLYDFGNADSVETMVVDTDRLAQDPYVSWTLRHAEAIWMAGGDQATYLGTWMGTPVEDAIEEAWGRGAIVGGTSAGLAVLGEFMFAAYNDTVYSYEALEDPYNQYMTMEQGFLEIPMMAGVITDSHFADRDRMGRLVGFLARIHADGWAADVTGLGVDEQTAVIVGPDGEGSVIGQGSVYVVRADHPAEECSAGVALEYSGLELYRLMAGETLSFPGATAMGSSSPLGASGGVTVPADPY